MCSVIVHDLLFIIDRIEYNQSQNIGPKQWATNLLKSEKQNETNELLAIWL